MKKIFLAAAAVVLLGGFGVATAPASAAVTAPTTAVAGETTVDQVRMMRRHRMMRHRMMRHRMMRRRMGSSMNSKNPSRPGYQQNLGGTSRGYR